MPPEAACTMATSMKSVLSGEVSEMTGAIRAHVDATAGWRAQGLTAVPCRPAHLPLQVITHRPLASTMATSMKSVLSGEVSEMTGAIRAHVDATAVWRAQRWTAVPCRPAHLPLQVITHRPLASTMATSMTSVLNGATGAIRASAGVMGWWRAQRLSAVPIHLARRLHAMMRPAARLTARWTSSPIQAASVVSQTAAAAHLGEIVPPPIVHMVRDPDRGRANLFSHRRHRRPCRVTRAM
jgi:hypothetical protein